MNWQPIETAPKDGTVIDLWVPDAKNAKYSAHRIPSCKWDDKKGWVLDLIPIKISSLTDAPTHWMPLPEPPTNSKPVKKA